MRRRVLSALHARDGNNAQIGSGNQHRRRATDPSQTGQNVGFCHSRVGLFGWFSVNSHRYSWFILVRNVRNLSSLGARTGGLNSSDIPGLFPERGESVGYSHPGYSWVIPDFTLISVIS